MALRTQLWTLLPWIGGLNTSAEPALIPENQLANSENVISGLNDSKHKREGIQKNWASRSTNSYAVIGGGDFFFFSDSQINQTRISIDSNGGIYAHDPDDGTSTQLTVSGISLVSPTISSVQVINSTFIAAFDKSTNRIKKIENDGVTCTDLLNRWDLTSVSRSSSGTTRVVILAQSFKGVQGDYVVVSGIGNAAYNGTFITSSVTTSAISNDTIHYTAGSSLSESSTADTAGTVQGIAPNGSILGVHQGRLLTNDKDRPYRVNYSPPGDAETWLGWGDSGAIDLDPGDNDSHGVTAIFPTFQGDLFISKRTKLYRISGIIPDHTIEKVTDSLGCLGQEAVSAVDQSDVVWVSEKGVHSIAQTQKHGDVEESFLSKDIQYSFNGSGQFGWDPSRKNYIKVRYLTTKNLLFFAVTEKDLNGTVNNCLWTLNSGNGQWESRWPNVDCETAFVGRDSDKDRLYLGSSTGRIYKTFTGTKTDTSESGVSSGIPLLIKTGNISVDKNPYLIKGFKRLVLYYTPKGNQVITALLKVDAFKSRSVSFTQGGTGALLGVDFVLGQSSLGSSGIFGAYSRLFDGYGRTLQITLSESGSQHDYSIEGIGVEYQVAGVRYQVGAG